MRMSWRWLAVAVGLIATPAAADTISVTDLAGRTVTVEGPVERFIVSEGRYIPLLALLRPDDPIKGLVGMMSPLGWTQPGLQKQLDARFPEAASIPLFGNASADSVSVERIVDLDPQLAIFGLSDHGPGTRNAEMIAQLDAAGIAVVFIDFRLDPMNNTIPSIELVGRLLGDGAAAADYINFYRARLQRIADRVAETDQRPRVFVQVHPGRHPCCWAMADGMLGPFVGLAGGENIADALAPGPVSHHTAEFLLTENPDVWIGTASGTVEEFQAGADPVAIGAGMTPETAGLSLRRYLSAPEFAALGAVQSGRAHAIWHNFYNSPFNVVAVEAFATWIHPALFSDIDPRATLAEIFETFLPFEVDGTYFATIGHE